MKIIKEGKDDARKFTIPKAWWHHKRGTCEHCECTIEVDSRDRPNNVYTGNASGSGQAYFYCPNCSMSITVHGEQVVK